MGTAGRPRPCRDARGGRRGERRGGGGDSMRDTVVTIPQVTISKL